MHSAKIEKFQYLSVFYYYLRPFRDVIIAFLVVGLLAYLWRDGLELLFNLLIISMINLISENTEYIDQQNREIIKLIIICSLLFQK